jgi:23S rRNA pseudouridine1911/1915/1917 synthase
MGKQTYPKLEILYEDNYLIAVNKPPGLIVQGDRTGDISLVDMVKAYLRKTYLIKEPFVGLPHRLDRPTSGIVLLAKKKSVLKELNKAFSVGKIRKTYWAVVNHKPPKSKDTITHYLWKNQQQNKTYALDYPKPGSKQGSLTYNYLGNYKNKYHLLEIYLHTGRHHQIRAQLLRLGCKIIGDVKYGYKSANPDASIFLHARKLSFFHPVNQNKITIFARPPHNEVWDYFYNKFKKRK